MVKWKVGTEIILFTELPEIIPFSFGKESVNQGDFAQLTCVVTRGDKPLTITWSLKGDIVSSDPTLTTTMLGSQASMLVISSVDYHHSGVYTCRAENPAGVTTYSTELKVNGKSSWKALNIILFTENSKLSCVCFDHHLNCNVWREQCGKLRRLCVCDVRLTEIN